MSDDPKIPDAEKKEAIAFIDQHVNQLSERFDSVQIFVTLHRGDKDCTMQVNRGSGNWYTRFGQIEEWITYEHERARIEARPKPE